MTDYDPGRRLGDLAGADELGRGMGCFNLVTLTLCAGAYVWAASFNHWWPF